MNKELRCSLETRTSKKGSEYQVIVIKLTDTYEKLVFPEKAEIELINASSNLSDYDKFKF